MGEIGVVYLRILWVFHVNSHCKDLATNPVSTPTHHRPWFGKFGRRLNTSVYSYTPKKGEIHVASTKGPAA